MPLNRNHLMVLLKVIYFNVIFTDVVFFWGGRTSLSFSLGFFGPDFEPVYPLGKTYKEMSALLESNQN